MKDSSLKELRQEGNAENQDLESEINTNGTSRKKAGENTHAYTPTQTCTRNRKLPCWGRRGGLPPVYQRPSGSPKATEVIPHRSTLRRLSVLTSTRLAVWTSAMNRQLFHFVRIMRFGFFFPFSKFSYTWLHL